MKEHRLLLQVGATIGVIVAVPIIIDLALFIQHAASYKGVCGPHAPDLPAYACSYNDYLVDFLGGLGAIALVMIDVLAMGATAFLALFGWGLRALLLAIRNSH